MIDDGACRTFVRAVEFAGRKWNAAILLALAREAHRYSEIRAIVTGISDRLLTVRLRELETHGLVDRTVIPTTPVQVQYDLTASGRELISALNSLNGWGQRQKSQISLSVQAESDHPLSTPQRS
jgi:DNA-binding HxlR family transcriptional regulator